MTHPINQAGQPVQPAFFGPRLGFLSNFDTTPFYVPALDAVVKSGEHAFNAFKTVSPDEQLRVLEAPTPSKAKYVGRSVQLRPGWDTGLRVRAMRAVLVAKFAPSVQRTSDGASLLELLLATGEERLVETNTWHDQFWGDCLCAQHAGQPGVNMLGELLMAFRSHASSCAL